MNVRWKIYISVSKVILQAILYMFNTKGQNVMLYFLKTPNYHIPFISYLLII